MLQDLSPGDSIFLDWLCAGIHCKRKTEVPSRLLGHRICLGQWLLASFPVSLSQSLSSARCASNALWYSEAARCGEPATQEGSPFLVGNLLKTRVCWGGL